MEREPYLHGQRRKERKERRGEKGGIDAKKL